MKVQWLRLATPVTGLALLAVAVALYLLNFPLYFRALSMLGAYPLKQPFLDWENVAASIDCWRHGVDVYVSNSCDLLGRPFAYSPIWLRATFLPAGDQWRYIVGLSLGVLFFSSQYLVCRPTTWAEAGTCIAASSSPVVIFAAERANVDLIIFLMLTGAASIRGRSLAGRLTVYTAILSAGLLKFYPFFGLVVSLGERMRTAICVLLVSALAIAAFYFGFRSEIGEMARNIPQGRFGLDSFGAPNLLYAFPATRSSKTLWGIGFAMLSLLAIAVAVSISRNAGFARAFAGLGEREKLVLTLGAAVVAGCFFAGQNIDYRGVFLILVLAGLMAMRRNADEAAIRSRLGWLLVLVIALMWEGFYPVMWLFGGSAWAPFVLLREVLWWYLAAALLAVLMTFISQSQSIASGMRWARSKL